MYLTEHLSATPNTNTTLMPSCAITLYQSQWSSHGSHLFYTKPLAESTVDSVGFSVETLGNRIIRSGPMNTRPDHNTHTHTNTIKKYINCPPRVQYLI